MFGFGKKKDPKESLEQADKALNKGVSGFMAKTFMGKEFMDQTNAALNTAKQYAGAASDLKTTGMPGTAEVLSIADTGTLINYDPVVIMKLRVQPAYGPSFETETKTIVSKVAIPRVGDKISVKYNAVNTSEMIVIS
jgi:hypothetical protein